MFCYDFRPFFFKCFILSVWFEDIQDGCQEGKNERTQKQEKRLTALWTGFSKKSFNQKVNLGRPLNASEEAS